MVDRVHPSTARFRAKMAAMRVEYGDEAVSKREFWREAWKSIGRLVETDWSAAKRLEWAVGLCPSCMGAGEVGYMDRGRPDYMRCKRCRGTGRVS